jgi:hypothetical protein
VVEVSAVSHFAQDLMLLPPRGGSALAIRRLEEMGVEAKGAVGADDPLLAFEDAIRQFNPGHILIALRDEQRAGWQERGLLDQVLGRFGLPITVFQL